MVRPVSIADPRHSDTVLPPHRHQAALAQAHKVGAGAAVVQRNRSVPVGCLWGEKCGFNATATTESEKGGNVWI